MDYTIIMVPDSENMREISERNGRGGKIEVSYRHYEMMNAFYKESRRLAAEVERLKEIISRYEKPKGEKPKAAIQVTMKCRK